MLLGFNNLSNSSGASEFVPDINYFEVCIHYTESHQTWAFCTVLCFAVGFPASIAILWEMSKTHREWSAFTPNDFFILNLSVMDAVFLVFIPPGLLNYLIFHTHVLNSIWDCVFALNIIGRPLLMACVCFDCYLAVVHPITYHKRKSLTPRLVIVAIVWTLTLCNGVLFAIYNHLYYSMFTIWPYVVAIVIIGVCDSCIIHTLIKSDPGMKKIHPQKKRALQTLTYSLVMALISYLPPLLLFVFGISLIPNTITFICTIAVPISITTTLGSAVMPVLYLANFGKLDRFRCGCCRNT